jgi:radical SAM superfamily enzyme YgiQ (UPF0313 family)
MKVYLGDLFHTWTKGGTWTIPLNVGYVAAYLIKRMNDHKIKDIQVKLFKDPEKMLDAIDQDPPDIAALGFFVWNNEINKFIFNHIKEKHPQILTVGGGPRFTNINANLEGAKAFFNEHRNCDVFTINQGEKGFFNVAKKFYDCSLDVKKLKKEAIPGSMVNDAYENKIHIKNCDHNLHLGENIGTIENLNDIPSPYLTGLLDEFFEDRYAPIIETNRSCPYRCTFCAWGIGTQKLQRFDEQRVIDEIDYIGKKCKLSKTLFIADANFGILERDAIFAKSLYESHKKNEWPQNVAVQWNKTRPDRVLKVAKEFKSIAAVGASMQSLSKEVLDAIKRKNLTFEQVVGLQNDLKKIGVNEKSFTELILGLPNETKETHLYAIKTLIDYGFEVWNYFLHLLPGTEMDDKNYRKKYFKKTVFRLHDNSYGIYRGKKVFESQETVSETSTMIHEEFKYFRFFHFLIQMMWSKKWYYYFLVLLKNRHDIHPVEFIKKAVEMAMNKESEIHHVYKEFISIYEDAENFNTEEDLQKYWSIPENFERLRDGTYGKLNMLFTYKIILDNKNEFSSFLFKVCEELADIKKINKDIFINECKEILKFQNCKFLTFKNNDELVHGFEQHFSFDVIKWINSGYKVFNKIEHSKNYNFYLTDNKKQTLETQLKNNKSASLNAKFRDMTVYTSTDQFFYDVR